MSSLTHETESRYVSKDDLIEALADVREDRAYKSELARELKKWLGEALSDYPTKKELKDECFDERETHDVEWYARHASHAGDLDAARALRVADRKKREAAEKEHKAETRRPDWMYVWSLAGACLLPWAVLALVLALIRYT